MTRRMLVTKKVKDLKFGDKYVGWGVHTGGLYPPGKRILDLKIPYNDRDRIQLVLDSGEKLNLFPDMSVVVEVLA